MAKRKDVKFDISAEDKSSKAFKSAQKNMQNLASSAAVLQGPLGPIAGRLNAIGAALGRMSGFAVGGSVALASTAVGISLTAKAAGDLEQQMLKLDAVLRATGRDSETSAQEMNDFARSLGEATLTSAEAVRSAQASLATFSNIDTKDFQQVLTLSQDISATFGGELRQNTIKLARALDNPREGLSGLSRNVLATSVAWREMVASMAESGQKAEAQALVIDAIKAKVSGAGSAEAGGLVGAIDTLGERWTRALESLGETGPLKLATRGIQALSSALSSINIFLEEDVVALDKYNKELKPFADIMAILGESTQFLDPTNLREVDAVLKSLALRGIDLAGAAPFLRLERDIAKAEKTAKLMDETLDRIRGKQGLEAAIFVNENKLEAQRQRITALKEAYDDLFIVRQEDSELTAILAKRATSLIDRLTKKSMTQVEQIQSSMSEVMTSLLQTGTAGAEMRGQIESAYLAFVLGLHNKATDAAQKRANKVVAIEEKKVARLMQVLQSQQSASPLDGAGQSASDREDQRYQIALNGIQRREAATIASYGRDSEQYRLLTKQRTLQDEIHAEKSRQISEGTYAKLMQLERSLKAEKASAIPAPGQSPDILPSEVENDRYALLLEGIARREETILEAHGRESEQYANLMREKTLQDQLHAERSRQIEEQLVRDKHRLNISAVQGVGNLLAIVGQKSKAAAKAAEIVQKALMIQQTIASTQAAAMRAYAELGPIAGPPVAAGIIGLGAAAVAVIATSSSSPTGGAGGGIGQGGGGQSGPSSIPALSPPASSGQVTFVIVGNSEFDESQLDGIMDGISAKINDGSQILIRRDSPQAQEIAQAIEV